MEDRAEPTLEAGVAAGWITPGCPGPLGPVPRRPSTVSVLAVLAEDRDDDAEGSG